MKSRESVFNFIFMNFSQQTAGWKLCFVTSRTCSSIMHVEQGDRKQCLFIESYIRKKYHIQKQYEQDNQKKNKWRANFL